MWVSYVRGREAAEAEARGAVVPDADAVDTVCRALRACFIEVVEDADAVDAVRKALRTCFIEKGAKIK